MKNIIVLASIVFFVNGAPAQKRSTISISYPLFEEFDFDTKVQKTLDPSFANLHLNPPKLSMPLTVIISYRRFLSSTDSYRLNWLLLFNNNIRSYYYPKVTGQSMDISYTAFSLDYLKGLWRNYSNSISLDLYFSSKVRLGRDVVFIENHPTLTQFPEREIKDLGISGGLVYNFYLPLGIVLTTEAGLTRWLFMYYHHFSHYSNLYKLPKNSFDLRISLGMGLGGSLE